MWLTPLRLQPDAEKVIPDDKSQHGTKDPPECHGIATQTLFGKALGSSQGSFLQV